jgi:hypothetical protein
MQKFIAGLLLGLSLAALPVVAEFGWTDTMKLGEIETAVKLIAADLAAIRKDGIACNTK